MSDQVIENNTQEREKLGPVVSMIFGIYVALMVIGYLVGNMIYQIP